MSEAVTRWNNKRNTFEPSPAEVEAFLGDIERVCRQHGMTLSHEDKHGAFMIEGWSDANIEWLRDAHDDRQP